MQADEVGRIGIRKLLAGEVANHATVDVNYIRRSDAEIFRHSKAIAQGWVEHAPFSLLKGSQSAGLSPAEAGSASQK